MNENLLVARRCRFSSAHLYFQPKFTEAQNRAEFGACFSKHGHGHNYILEAFIEGPLDPNSRLVVDLAVVDDILKKVTGPLDHRHLNFEISAFRDVIPTTENIALYLREKILDVLNTHPTLKLNRIRLYEYDDLWVEVIA